MELYHYSAEPLVLNREQKYVFSIGPKPRGLWLSVGDEWKRWAQVNLPHHSERFRFRSTVLVGGRTKLAILDNPIKIRQFSNMYRGTGTRFPDWGRVAQDYDGILITVPDREPWWLSSWDVKSACIWRFHSTYVSQFANQSDALRDE